jgi:hypothetical protein
LANPATARSITPTSASTPPSMTSMTARIASGVGTRRRRMLWYMGAQIPAMKIASSSGTRRSAAARMPATTMTTAAAVTR